MELLKKVFSSAPGIDRINLWGAFIMLLGVICALWGDKILIRFIKKRNKQQKDPSNAGIAVKLAGVAVCAVGAFIAIRFN